MRFVTHRGGAALVTLVVAISLAVVLSDLGGDPVLNILGPSATRSQIEAERVALGLDRPVWMQVVSTLGHVATGDLGTSLRYGRPCTEIILSRLPASIELMCAALAIAVLLGVPLGTLAATREGSWVDRVAMSVALMGQSMPLYWLGMVAVLAFSVNLRWFPSAYGGGIDHLVLPAAVLATLPLGAIARLTRASMSQTLEEGYVAAARARGLKPLAVVGHALRNALLPVVTMIGLQAGGLLSGAVTVEVVFAWPGIGSLAVDAVSFRDFRLVEAIVIFGAVVFVSINFAVDVLYGFMDPRVRRGTA